MKFILLISLALSIGCTEKTSFLPNDGGNYKWLVEESFYVDAVSCRFYVIKRKETGVRYLISSKGMAIELSDKPLIPIER
jgi:hypothetical protein